MSEQKTIEIKQKYNGGGKRLFARFIDSGIFIIGLIAIIAALAGIVNLANLAENNDAMGWIIISFFVLVAILDLFLSVIVPAYIFKSQSIGKKIMKLKMIDAKSEDISLLRLLGRWAIFQVTAFFYIIFVSFITILATEKKQALHDMIMRTYVVEA